MTGALVDWLAGRAPRERWLLGLLVVVVLPAALWLGVLAPLAERRAAAEAALAEARALQGWVADRAADMAALGPAPATTGARAPIGSAGLEQSLIVAGLRRAVSDLAGDGTGAVTLRFDAVDFRKLVVWMSGAEADWGYAIARLRLRATDRPGQVAADLDLVPG